MGTRKLTTGTPDRRLQRLHAIIAEQSILRGDFTLSSGRKSTYLFQLRQTTLHPEGASLISDLIVDFMKVHRLTCLGGMVQGAVPIVAAVSARSFLEGYPVQAFFVRKEAKKHGAEELVDGFMTKDGEVLLIDDVTTTGGSMLETLERMVRAGFTGKVDKALSVIDRQEGAAENLAARGIALHPLFTKQDFDI
jgi:orotate phosphoribosyltransferase